MTKKLLTGSNRNTAVGGNVTFASKTAPAVRNRQYYAVSMTNHEIVQVTTGTGVRDLLLGHKKNVAFRFRDNNIIEFNIGALLADSEQGKPKDSASYEKIIASIPAELKPGGMCLDYNDSRIFFSTRAGENSSAIYSVNLATSKTAKLTEVPFRTGHFQANPFVCGEIMYCWETGGDSPQRMWILSVDKHGKAINRPVYNEKVDEWVTHEVFAGPDQILFNVMGHIDRLRKNPTGIMSLNIRTGKSKLLGQAKELGGYWHAFGTPDLKWAVADTFNGNIYRINTATGKTKLLTTGHRPNTQSPFSSQAHAYQSISPDGKWILFNSSLLMESDIMMVPLQ